MHVYNTEPRFQNWKEDEMNKKLNKLSEEIAFYIRDSRKNLY